jgi:hypothetical protein
LGGISEPRRGSLPRSMPVGRRASRARAAPRGGAIDLEKIATPEILDPRQVQGLHPGLRSRNVLETLADLVYGNSNLFAHCYCSLSVHCSVRLRLA